MSVSLEEKLSMQRPTQGKASCTFQQLSSRFGVLRVRGDVAELTSMGKHETWVRVCGRGLEATYELKREKA